MEITAMEMKAQDVEMDVGIPGVDSGVVDLPKAIILHPVATMVVATEELHEEADLLVLVKITVSMRPNATDMTIVRN
jgi:hypothetical protein